MAQKRTELISWVGVLFLLSAYFSVSRGLVQADSILYQLLNMLGSGGMILYGSLRRAWAIVFFNIIWGGIAAYSLLQILS